ncbi:MAG: hypothetical protein RL612_812 [Actinomycetota bacterium]|jgi:hypothetical protein
MISLKFSTEVIYWRGPAPFYFAPVPDAQVKQIKDISSQLSYGWGVIPARVKVGKTEFTTSLFPRQGGYMVPIKNVVREAEKLDVDDKIVVHLFFDD